MGIAGCILPGRNTFFRLSVDGTPDTSGTAGTFAARAVRISLLAVNATVVFGIAVARPAKFGIVGIDALCPAQQRSARTAAYIFLGIIAELASAQFSIFGTVFSAIIDALAVRGTARFGRRGIDAVDIIRAVVAWAGYLRIGTAFFGVFFAVIVAVILVNSADRKFLRTAPDVEIGAEIIGFAIQLTLRCIGFRAGGFADIGEGFRVIGGTVRSPVDDFGHLTSHEYTRQYR